jgi:colicin import membrane protein
MKGPSLQKTAVLSAGLHVTFFLLAFLVLRQSSNIVMPSPYVVSLVSPGKIGQKATAPPAAASVQSPRAAAESRAVAPKKEAPGFDEKKAEKLVKDRIAALEAKHRIKEKHETLGRIRKELTAIRAGGEKAPKKSSAQTGAAGEASGGETYIDKVASEIHEEWHWPDYMKKDLEAVISMKIERDGTISQVRFEKKSGDGLFDRSIAQAIAKASPVTPPPYEMEIGVRFYP